MSAVSLRTRQPLESLPLAPYTSMAGPSSPVALPHKRSLTSSPGRIGESSATKLRKVSGVEASGQETIKKEKNQITPRAKKALAQDELGTGKSPARRLFVDDRLSLGISGATIPSSAGPSRHLDYPDVASSTAGPSRTLAPSPPLSTAPSPNPHQHENDADVDVHDVGFDILPDPVLSPSASASIPTRTPLLGSFLPSSSAAAITAPGGIAAPDNDQENVPPPQRTPTSARSTPSKSSVSGCSTASSSRFYNDDDIVNITGSGRKRVRERSKLNNEVVRSVSVSGPIVDADDNDELTPGRSRTADKGKGKQKMALEVDHS